MENKLTAVEFLADNLHYLHSTKWEDILIKAKEMEKQLIIETFKYAQVLHAIGDEMRAEQYYYNLTNK